MYVNPDFRTKKAFKEAVARGDDVSYYQPGPFGGNETQNGTFCAEGPHYPKPHTWYASVTVVAGKIVGVK